MKRAAPILLALVVVVVLGIRWAIQSRKPSPPAAEKISTAGTSSVPAGVILTTISPPTIAQGNQPTPLLGETILRDFGKTNLPPANDLTLLSRLMDNFMLLVKSAADRPLSANEDWAAAFRGANPAHESFLPDRHVALGADGKLVDRWGTPLFIHALGGKRFEIRSAGPDGKMWTADDIHRNADGSFRHGAELNAPSLLENASPRPLRRG